MLRVDSGFACCVGHAVDEIAEALHIPVEKASINPLAPSGYLRIVAQVRRALAAAAGEGEAQAVALAIRELDVDWPNLNAAAREAVIEVARAAIGTAPARALPSISGVLRVAGPRVMGSTREAATRRWDFTIGASLSQRDHLAERYLRLSTANFIRDHYGVRRDELAATARDVVARGLEQGLGRAEIARDLNTALGSTVMRGDSYWQLIAGQFVNSARTFSEIGAFQEAGVQSYAFTAVLDEVTTDECRFYDGQIFPLSGAIAARDQLSTLTNPNDVYNVAPWVRSGRAEDGSRIIYVDRGNGREVIATIDRSGVGARDDRGSYSNALTGAQLAAMTPPLPPLHAYCRSTIEPASYA